MHGDEETGTWQIAASTANDMRAKNDAFLTTETTENANTAEQPDSALPKTLESNNSMEAVNHPPTGDMTTPSLDNLANNTQHLPVADNNHMAVDLSVESGGEVGTMCNGSPDMVLVVDDKMPTRMPALGTKTHSLVNFHPFLVTRNRY